MNCVKVNVNLYAVTHQIWIQSVHGTPEIKKWSAHVCTCVVAPPSELCKPPIRTAVNRIPSLSAIGAAVPEI